MYNNAKLSYKIKVLEWATVPQTPLVSRKTIQRERHLFPEHNRGRSTKAKRSASALVDLFPKGMLISAINPVKSAEQTQIAIRDGASCIFEASFIFENTWVRCDILQKDEDSWNLIEVKMSTSVKEEHLADLAIQKYVLTGCGIPISKTHLMHINNKCAYPDLSDLFTSEDVTDRVDLLMDDIPNAVEALKTILDDDVEPDVLIGEQCDKPYPCPFKAYCWEAVPEKSTLTIPRLSWQKKRCTDRGRYLSDAKTPYGFLTDE